MCSYLLLMKVLFETAFHTCLEIVADLIIFARTIHASYKYLVDLMLHIWPPARRVPYCSMSARRPVMLIFSEGTMLSYVSGSCSWRTVFSRWLRGRFLLDPCRHVLSFDPQDSFSPALFAFFAKRSSYFTKCVTFPVKCVALLTSFFPLLHALFEEVTLGASTLLSSTCVSCWSTIFYIAPLSTGDLWWILSL